MIVETPNKHYSTLLKTRVWIVRSKFFKYRNIQAESQKHQTVLVTLELPHFIVFTAIHSVVYFIWKAKQSTFAFTTKHTASPWHSCINTTALTETTPSFFAWTFGRQQTNISTSWRRHVGACLNEPVLGGRGRILTLIKNISLGLRL